jgi:hypothetical protein
LIAGGVRVRVRVCVSYTGVCVSACGVCGCRADVSCVVCVVCCVCRVLCGCVVRVHMGVRGCSVGVVCVCRVGSVALVRMGGVCGFNQPKTSADQALGNSGWDGRPTMH